MVTKGTFPGNFGLQGQIRRAADFEKNRQDSEFDKTVMQLSDGKRCKEK